MSVALEDFIRKQVLPRFPVMSRGQAAVAVVPMGGGLINQTFAVTAGAERWVLQRVNPLFSPSIHHNIHAVTVALTKAGLTTPTLVPTHEGRLWLDVPPDNPGAQPSVWRLLTHVDGVSFDVVASPAQAHAAGALVARFHAALENFHHVFVGQRGGVHDTARHLTQLEQMSAGHQSHRLFAQVAPLADRIFTSVRALPALPILPPRICHGDLKFNNFLFASAASPGREHAVCIVDLDTVGPLALAFELGDAWRSWCNRSGEDDEQSSLDLAIFAASLEGYRQGLGRVLTSGEKQALLLGPEWISLELAARFAADALAESYFGWDAQRFPGRGEHNLVRARGQFSLHQELTTSRADRARLLAAAP